MLSTLHDHVNPMDECVKSSIDSNVSDNEQDGIRWRSNEQHDPKLYVDASSTDNNSTDNAQAESIDEPPVRTMRMDEHNVLTMHMETGATSTLPSSKQVNIGNWAEPRYGN